MQLVAAARVDHLMRHLLLVSVCVGTLAFGHDVSADVVGTLTSSSANNPRAGSFGASIGGAVDVTDAFSFWAGFSATREFGTNSGQVSTTGANIFMINAGAMYLPTDSISLMLTANLAPPTAQRSALLVGASNVAADTVLISNVNSFGFGLTGGYLTDNEGDVDHGVDVSASLTRFGISQRAELPMTTRGDALRTVCMRNPTLGNCELLTGVNSNMLQARLGATYTLMIRRTFTAGLDGAVFIYDQDPTKAGVYTLVVAGREVGDIGNGVPVSPLLFSLKPFASWKPGKFAVKLSYQAGLYVSALGVNHVISLRPSYRITDAFRMNLTVTAQFDSGSSGVTNPGGSATLGALYEF